MGSDGRLTWVFCYNIKPDYEHIHIYIYELYIYSICLSFTLSLRQKPKCFFLDSMRPGHMLFCLLDGHRHVRGHHAATKKKKRKKKHQGQEHEAEEVVSKAPEVDNSAHKIIYIYK